MPYDEIMNSAIPWAAVLFAGFFPAFSEEFLSRAFAIPFIQKYARSRMVAIVVAAFIWGFGHSAYPNQPFWIRGVEVGLAGIVAGLLPGVARYFPGAAGFSIVGINGDGLLAPASAAIVLATYALTAVVAGAALMRRRDIA